MEKACFSCEWHLFDEGIQVFRLMKNHIFFSFLNLLLFCFFCFVFLFSLISFGDPQAVIHMHAVGLNKCAYGWAKVNCHTKVNKQINDSANGQEATAICGINSKKIMSFSQGKERTGETERNVTHFICIAVFCLFAWSLGSTNDSQSVILAKF